MKVLHTGDLHLGKSLHETSLLDDQRYMLNNLRLCLAKDDYTALLITGDIYDRTIPPSEAVELFSDFLVRLREDFPDLTVFLIPGNHDSAQRLSYADRILGHQHIHIICNPEQTFNPIIISAKTGERIAFFLLPFLAAGTLKVADTPKSASELDFDGENTPVLLSQADLAAEAARRLNLALNRTDEEGIPSVLLAHLLTFGGKQSESERQFIGNAEQVSPALFSRFTYTALGHLHRTQRVTDRMYYAGAPLAYAFDEAGTEKVFLSVDIDSARPSFPVSVTPIPVQPFRKVSRLSGSFSEFYTGSAFDSFASDYVEITLTDDSLVANPMNLLRPKFPYLLSLKQGAVFGIADRGRDEENADGKADEKRDPVTDFCRFQEMLYGTVDPEKKTLFISLLEECADET